MDFVNNRRKAFLILLLLFFVSILLRLPNLNRPVSKHHEFNTAVILINNASWRQAGGGSVFHYTPLMNFQHPGDKDFEKGPYIDSKGNHVYLSYGPGWYVIPYAFYRLFHLPNEPVYLQILNLFFNFATLFMLFFLFEKIVPAEESDRYLIVLTGCCLFMFSPGILWYFGNGYINVDIMMPFVAAALLLLLPMLQSPQLINAPRLGLLFLLIILLIYIDWFIFFAAIVASCIAVFNFRKHKNYAVLLAVLPLASITGIAIVFFQFASYTGWHNVLTYWQMRFFDRGVNATAHSYPHIAALIGTHLLTAYLPLLLLAVVSFLVLKLKKIPWHFSKQELFFLKFYTACILLYNLVLLNWTSGHEFSLIPFSFLPAYLGARLVTRFKQQTFLCFTCFFMLLSTGQYYFINRPGAVSRDGMRYDSYKKMGDTLKQIPADYKIFINMENCPMAEYYAGRNFTQVNNYAEAKNYMLQYGLTKGVWVDQEQFRLQKITVIEPDK